MSKIKKTTAKRRRTKPERSRSQSVRGMRKNARTRKLGRFVVPVFICIVLLAGIGFFGLMGYRTATASEFFSVRRVDVRGVERASGEDIRRIVLANTEKSGVWQADLSAIREKIEKLPFVKTASVSMELPSGVRVNVVERVPSAIVRLPSGDVLADSEGYLIAAAGKNEASIPFVLKGWDESKTEKAPADNQQRLKIYRKIVDEAKELGVSDRVREVNLADLREPMAVVVDSGKPITVILGRDNLGKSLKTAIEAVAGKGERVKSVNASGISPVLEFLGN